jgi:hypothetical protein
LLREVLLRDGLYLFIVAHGFLTVNVSGFIIFVHQ